MGAVKYWTKKDGVWVQMEVGDIDVSIANQMVFCGECEHLKSIYGGLYGSVSNHVCKAEVVKVKYSYFQATSVYARCRVKNKRNDCRDFCPAKPKTPPKPTDRPPVPDRDLEACGA